jgi:hypothetical protein
VTSALDRVEPASRPSRYTPSSERKLASPHSLSGREKSLAPAEKRTLIRRSSRAWSGRAIASRNRCWQLYAIVTYIAGQVITISALLGNGTARSVLGLCVPATRPSVGLNAALTVQHDVQEHSLVLCKLIVHYHIHKSPPIDPVLTTLSDLCPLIKKVKLYN